MPRIKKNIQTAQEEAEVIKTSARAAQRVKDRPKKAPKKGIMELQQADSKLYNKHGVKSIDELLGISDNKYDTHDVKKYMAQLEKMNLSDLQRHAITVQIMPKEDRRILTQLLVKQFRINNSTQLNQAEEVLLTAKLPSQDVLDILAEGR